jgi:uncharacterized protein YceH (UPF0502 family)
MVTLDPVEARVLGCLIEKEITTPEYYPLTLNALVNACNQKSNRDPLVNYSEEDVEDALLRLREKRLSTLQTGSRATKYGHRAVETLNLGRREVALMCELLVRGPQTLGELRSRAERMHNFSDLEEVEACLRGLMSRQPDPLVARLERHTGMKEPRYAHLLSGEPSVSEDVPMAGGAGPGRQDRLAALESEVGALKEQMRRLEEQFERFRTQFE